MANEATTCVRCQKPKHRGRCRKAEAATLADVVRKHTEPQRSAAPEPVTITGALEVPPGYGFRAAIENGVLALEQDSDTGTDNITLAAHEIRQLRDFIDQALANAA